MGLAYNPNNENIFDVTREKTDYQEVFDKLSEDIKETYQVRVCSGPFWRRRCWNETKSRPNETQNKINKKIK